MKKYYLMRSPSELVNKNRLGYGWKVDFSQCASSKEILSQIKEAYPQGCGRKKKQIQRFFNLKKGDIVLVPQPRKVVIGLVLGDKFYDSNASSHGWNQVDVNFRKDNGELRTVSTRSGVITNKLLSRLRVRCTNTSLDEFSSEIDNLINQTDTGSFSIVEKYEQSESGKENEFKSQLLRNLRTGKTRLQGGGDGFEKLIYELLQVDGYSEIKISSKKSNEGTGDIDIEATKNLGSLLPPLKLCIQAKHHKGNTGHKAVDQLKIAKENKEAGENSILMVISTGSFHDDLRHYADESDIILKDGEDFVAWLCENISRLSTKKQLALGVSLTPTFIND